MILRDVRVIVGAVVLVAAVVVALALWPEGNDPRVFDAEGSGAIGTVVAVEGDRVELTYQLAREEYRGTAFPQSGGPYTVGDVVWLAVLPDRTERVMIIGTETGPDTGDTLRWLAAVLGLIVGGLALVGWGVSANWHPSGDYPKERWIGERHGA